MVWLSKSVPRGQFTWLLEFLTLPIHSIFVDLHRNQYKELQLRIRSGANLCCSRRCHFVKSKHLLHLLHYQLLIHLPHPCRRGRPNMGRNVGQSSMMGSDKWATGLRVPAHHRQWQRHQKWFDNYTVVQELSPHIAGPSGRVPLLLPPSFEPAEGEPWPQTQCHHAGLDGGATYSAFICQGVHHLSILQWQEWCWLWLTHDLSAPSHLSKG